MALTDEDSPAFLPGFFQIALGSVARLAAHHRGRPQRRRASAGTSTTTTSTRAASASSAPATTPTWSQAWLPALDGVVAKLEPARAVADVGCGHGASTILMAEAYPRSTFVGSDYHAGSIETARQRAAEAGVADRVAFEVAPAAELRRRRATTS